MTAPPVCRREAAALSLILLVLLGLLVREAWVLGITVDEPSHLLSSLLWWKGRDRLYPRDVPPLMKFTGGWPGVLMKAKVADDLGRPGDKRLEWREAASFIATMPENQVQRYVFLSRLPLLVFPMLTVFVLWHWGRRLFGPVAGLAVAGLTSLSPTFLGHGALFKNDIAASCTYLLFWYAAWCFWRNPVLRRALLLAGAAALAMMSKMSMLFLLPVAVVILAVAGFRTGGVRRAATLVFAGLLLIYAVAAAAWQFEMHRATSEELRQLASDRYIPRWFTALAGLVQVIPVPEGAWAGVISLFRSAGAPVPVYMVGQIYPEGHRAYFLAATLLKLSIPTQILLVLSVAVLAKRRREVHDVFWLIPGFLYFALASLSSLQLGVRLVLPAWIFFFLLCGAGFEWLLRTLPGKAAAAALVVSLAVASASVYPYGISYFNRFVGGPRNALRYLADSNIDWGQALPEVGAFVRKEKIDRIAVAAFTGDQVWRHFRHGQMQMLPLPWSAKSAPPQASTARGWYAISATLLPGHLFEPAQRQHFAAFLRRRPVAILGGSMFVYFVE